MPPSLHNYIAFSRFPRTIKRPFSDVLYDVIGFRGRPSIGTVIESVGRVTVRRRNNCGVGGVETKEATESSARKNCLWSRAEVEIPLKLEKNELSSHEVGSETVGVARAGVCNAEHVEGFVQTMG